MQNANELRLNNIVLYKGSPIIVKGLRHNDISDVEFERYDKYQSYDDYAIDIEDIEHLPLTTEILEKCGFKDEWSGYCIQVNTGWLYINLERQSTRIEVAHHSEPIDVTLELPFIQYLHQLQNLFFTLTGEELSISL